jgi:uncharacterized protein
MRLTRYTKILRVTDNHILIFSAISDKFIICHKDLLHVYPDDSYNTDSPTLQSQLHEIMAICDDDFDEVSYLKGMIESTDNDTSEFHMHINPTLNCNFRCWYCYEEHQLESKMSENVISGIISLAKKEIVANHNLKTFTLSFFGGEPLMYYKQVAGILITNIQKLCEQANIKFRCHFTTNGYLLTFNIISSLDRVNVAFQITLDGGKQFHNKVRFSRDGRGSYNKILNNIKLLAIHHHEVLIRINYTAENIHTIVEIINDLKQFRRDIRDFISIDFQRVWQDRPTITEDEILSYISKYVHELNELGYMCAYSSNVGPSHVTNSCYGDKRNHLLINYDGNIFFCTARDFLPKNRVGKLNSDGRIIWEGNIINEYFTNKFSKEICYACKIAPLCGGGCRQRAKEYANINSCIYGYTQEEINQIILNRFTLRYIKN